MTVLSASVAHDGRGRAVAEFLIWIQSEASCSEVEVIGGVFCASSNASLSVTNTNFSCAVRGRQVPAHFETKVIRDYSDTSRESSKESVLTGRGCCGLGFFIMHGAPHMLWLL